MEPSIPFAGVRGSTAVAEPMSSSDRTPLMDRFCKATTRALSRKNTLVEKVIDDKLTGLLSRLCRSFTRQSWHRGYATNPKGDRARRSEPTFDPVEVGDHTSMTFVGSVSSEGETADMTVLGDTPNTGASIAPQARIGEVLACEAAPRWPD